MSDGIISGSAVRGERLLHYTSDPVEVVRSVDQEEPSGRYDKPRGLWVSVEGEDDWQSWCAAEDYGDPSAQFCYEVTLVQDAKILRLATSSDLLRFTRKYGCDPFLGPMAGRTSFFGHGIQWAEVAAEHDGIIIAPYNWTLRLDARTNWYYGWDCASGCIWNARAVACIAPPPEPASVQPLPIEGP